MKLRKIAAVLIAIVVLCAAPIGGLVGVDGMGFFAPQAEAAGKTYKVGDIVEFGSYPQSRVMNSSLVSSLNSVSKKWVSYGYYSGTGDYGTMVQGDWMKYADFTYNGTKYRAVTFSQYRPYMTDYLSSYSCQEDNGYTPNNIYYFKYEPLKWRVLDPSTGLVLCENIIDSQAYSNTIYEYGTDSYGGTAYWNDAEHTHYANDYATSSIRAWLNDDFYNTAFSSSQRAGILTSQLDNSAYSASHSKYNSETTYDKVFLLSYSEMRNTAYGFPANNTSSNSARQANGTDYAKCQGLRVYSADGCSDWCLRSAGIYSAYVCCVQPYGDTDTKNSVDYTGEGIRPAIKISNLSSAISKSGGSGSSSGNSNKNTTAKPAGGNNVVTDAPQSVTESETFAQINAEVEKEASTAEIKFYGDFKYIVVKANAYICGYSGSSKKVKIPSEIDGMPVVGITDNAFAKTSAQEITVPSSVSEFGKNAFGEDDGETRTIVATSGSPAEAYALSAGMNLKKHSTKSSSGIDDSTKFKVVAACAAFAVIGSAAVITLIVVKKCK
ncbi:MAG TPA: hypothetical protein DHV92_03510 [Ruminococcaceae bacterium]|jgi:hypothetical protein|nr:hypothetical protein [Oscillospiraceae bacterium]